MFKRLHWQMTFFSTLVTSLILVGMTLICLFIVRQEAQDQNRASFEENVSTIVAYLENQTQISAAWVRQIENNQHMKLDIRDNGVRLFSLKFLRDDDGLSEEMQKARDIARIEYGLDGEHFQSARSLSGSNTFEMDGENGETYLAGVALIPKEETVLEITVLYSLKNMKDSQTRQSILFGLVDLAAMVLLGIFSWFFTGRMIRPIEESRKKQTQFIAAASHELRSPLAVMLSSLSALKVADEAQAEQFIDTIQSEGQRMSHLIHDMLTLANADSHNWSIHPEKIELDTLLLQTYEKYEAMAREKGLSLSVRLPEEDCPPGAFDEERLAQVLSILLDNAMSYTPAPGKISLSLSVDGKSYRITVQDTGPGVPDAEKKAIFQRFYRVDRAHRDKSHFGLGLCIAWELVRLHRGKIWVEDAPEGGASFVVSLPMEREKIREGYRKRLLHFKGSGGHADDL